MTAWKWLALGLLCAQSAPGQVAPAPDNAAKPLKPLVEDIPAPRVTPSRVSAVTVYTSNALVTRELRTPEGKGPVELVISPLPSQLIDSSLYAEGSEGVRVLSTRSRRRAIHADARGEVRAKDEAYHKLQADIRKIEAGQKVVEADLEFLKKLEDFTGVTMKDQVAKGQLDAEATIALSKYIMETRSRKADDRVERQLKWQASSEAAEFTRNQINEISSGNGRDEADAVIVVDKADAAAGTVRLSYLVGSASWSPLYRLRAGGPKEPVQFETLAEIEQMSGEDWDGATLTLSTSEPSTSATLPDLLPLQLAVIRRDKQQEGKPVESNERTVTPQERRERIELRQMGQLNEAAASDQAQELLSRDDDPNGRAAETPQVANVTHHLQGNRNIPSRHDKQIVEISRSRMTPDFFDRAVPVLSPQVFRLAKLTNTGDAVILPGEASMYVGADFVGTMTLPQVAVGESFTVGFGVDPRMQIGRRLLKKSRSLQGGNQILAYEFRIVARNFGPTPVHMQVWDRLPKPEGEAVAVTLSESKPELSVDPLYVRTSRTENLLRWDLDVPANTTGEKAMAIRYGFQLAYARDVVIEDLISGGLKEKPIGGMGGMGGGMGGGFRSVKSQ